MKGIVFTELCEMVEEKFGIALLNEVIESSTLESKGIYSAVGTYDSKELNELVGKVSEKTGIPIQDLIHTYGRHFFDVLYTNYPQFFEVSDSFEFLKSIDSYIHVEVKKLYPEAELPRFSHIEKEKYLELIYESERGLFKFARGLIEKTIEHFGEVISIEEDSMSEAGSKVKFILKKGE